MKEWIHRCRRDVGKHFQVTRHTKICSRHFEESDFLSSGKRESKKRILKRGAVPTKFAWSVSRHRKEGKEFISLLPYKTQITVKQHTTMTYCAQNITTV